MVKILLTLSIYFLTYSPVYALSPGAKIRDCYTNNFAHGNCEKILCEWRNIDKNWPERTNYYEDCSGVKYSIFNLDILLPTVLIVFIGILTTLFIVKKRTKLNIK